MKCKINVTQKLHDKLILEFYSFICFILDNITFALFNSIAALFRHMKIKKP